jgi:predicted O-methyltransferase YrrM
VWSAPTAYSELLKVEPRAGKIMRFLETPTMNSSFIHKSVFGLHKAISSPRSTFSWIVRGHSAKDRLFVTQTYWFSGALPRVPLNAVLPDLKDVNVVLPRAFDRKSAASKSANMTVEEASHLGAIANYVNAKKVLEIGTADGNATLLLAANVGEGGTVVTVDLPLDFELAKQDSLAYPDGDLNLTSRGEVGRQYRGQAVSRCISQVYGDSAKIDWNELGGPFDLIFIDGCHTEAYVRSDSQNALKHLAEEGVIVWHDYGMIPEVSYVVDQLAREIPAIEMYAIEGTRLAVGLKQEISNSPARRKRGFDSCRR